MSSGDKVAQLREGVFPGWSDRFQRRLIVILAAAQALEAMDRGALGAVAPSLERALGISNSRLGLLVAVVSISTALATLPAGVLVDRIRRTRLLAWSLVLWSIAIVVSALSGSFLQLLASRVALGVVLATAGPVTASAVGDAVPDDKRADAIGRIRAGELVGMGAGFLLVGVVTSILSWRWVFVTLGALGAIAAWVVWGTDEPPRTADDPSLEHRPVRSLVRDMGVEPEPGSEVLDDPGSDLSLWQVVKYVLAVPTNRLLLVAEMVGDFFLSGTATFAAVFATQQYGISQSTGALLLPLAGVGALVGAVGGGRLGDWLITGRNIVPGRLWVAAAGYLLAVGALVPALFLRSIWLALPLLALAGLGLAASIPTVSAARLDVVVGPVWGRAEGVRTVLRTMAIAGAPLLVGFLSETMRGGGHDGLRLTILLLLPLVVVNSGVVLYASRHYAADVAAASETAERADAQRRGGTTP
jgi:predicted MFS family arabinose efflux permease